MFYCFVFVIVLWKINKQTHKKYNLHSEIVLAVKMASENRLSFLKLLILLLTCQNVWVKVRTDLFLPNVVVKALILTPEECLLLCLTVSVLLQLKILVEADMFKVAVDGVHLLEYEHRVGGLEDVTLLRVTGDLMLYSAAPSMI